MVVIEGFRFTKLILTDYKIMYVLVKKSPNANK
jgi:hypothetical protein